MHYRCKNFRIEELVSPDFHKRWKGSAWWFIDSGAAHDLDVIRDHFGVSVTINDWLWNGRYVASGLRQKGDQYFNPTSAHSFGRGFDIKVRGWKSKDVQAEIKKMKKDGKLKYITRLEVDTDGWTHIDTHNTEPNDDCGLFIFTP